MAYPWLTVPTELANVFMKSFAFRGPNLSRAGRQSLRFGHRCVKTLKNRTIGLAEFEFAIRYQSWYQSWSIMWTICFSKKLSYQLMANDLFKELGPIWVKKLSSMTLGGTGSNSTCAQLCGPAFHESQACHDANGWKIADKWVCLKIG